MHKSVCLILFCLITTKYIQQCVAGGKDKNVDLLAITKVGNKFYSNEPLFDATKSGSDAKGVLYPVPDNLLKTFNITKTAIGMKKSVTAYSTSKQPNSQSSKLQKKPSSDFVSCGNSAISPIFPCGYEGVIEGRSGVDYPTFGVIPRSSFNCAHQPISGYYADVDSRCQVFHVCLQKGLYDAVEKWSFLCPNGTVFSQEDFSCVWWNFAPSCDTQTVGRLYEVNRRLAWDKNNGRVYLKSIVESMLNKEKASRDEAEGFIVNRQPIDKTSQPRPTFPPVAVSNPYGQTIPNQPQPIIPSTMSPSDGYDSNGGYGYVYKKPEIPFTYPPEDPTTTTTSSPGSEFEAESDYVTPDTPFDEVDKEDPGYELEVTTTTTIVSPPRDEYLPPVTSGYGYKTKGKDTTTGDLSRFVAEDSSTFDKILSSSGIRDDLAEGDEFSGFSGSTGRRREPQFSNLPPPTASTSTVNVASEDGRLGTKTQEEIFQINNKYRHVQNSPQLFDNYALFVPQNEVHIQPKTQSGYTKQVKTAPISVEPREATPQFTSTPTQPPIPIARPKTKTTTKPKSKAKPRKRPTTTTTTTESPVAVEEDEDQPDIRTDDVDVDSYSVEPESVSVYHSVEEENVSTDQNENEIVNEPDSSPVIEIANQLRQIGPATINEYTQQIYAPLQAQLPFYPIFHVIPQPIPISIQAVPNPQPNIFSIQGPPPQNAPSSFYGASASEPQILYSNDRESDSEVGELLREPIFNAVTETFTEKPVYQVEFLKSVPMQEFSSTEPRDSHFFQSQQQEEGQGHHPHLEKTIGFELDGQGQIGSSISDGIDTSPSINLNSYLTRPFPYPRTTSTIYGKRLHSPKQYTEFAYSTTTTPPFISESMHFDDMKTDYNIPNINMEKFTASDAMNTNRQNKITR